MDADTAVNQRFWNEIAPLHAASDFYDVDRFLAGESTLEDVELTEVGDVTGKRLVHLMCHIGLDTLSWERAGAHVTGLDFSSESIRIAEDLAERVGSRAAFVCADVSDAADRLGTAYDLVFSSRGVLMWVRDLTRWAESCARLLEPGGVFYLLDIHPLAMTVVEGDGGLSVERDYFAATEPAVVVADGSYAVQAAGLANQQTREWIHPVGDVVTALATAGLRIEFVHEFPAGPGYRAPARLPALFSVRASRG